MRRNNIRKTLASAQSIDRARAADVRPAYVMPYRWPSVDKDTLAYLWLRWIRQGQTSLLTVTNLQTSRNPQTRMAAQQVAEFVRRPDWRLYV